MKNLINRIINRNIIKNLFLIIMLSPLVISCERYLDVSSESKIGEEYVFAEKEEIKRVLTSVYSALLTNDLYGQAMLSTFALNSDVEFTGFAGAMKSSNDDEFRRFDGGPKATSVRNLWNAAYIGLERANMLIHGIENGDIYDENDDELMQLLGEGKTLRAMIVHDMVVYFGDIPFSAKPAYLQETLIMPIVNRYEILDFLINDLLMIAPKMKHADELSGGITRATRDFCYALTARIALTRGGYSLTPDVSNVFAVGTMERNSDYKEYYQIAKTASEEVINAGRHKLQNTFRDVFIKECNYEVVNDDDPIFEIPFLPGSSGRVGDVTGPRVQGGSEETSHRWGFSNGGMRLNAFYRFSFHQEDMRRDYTVGLWEYNASNQPTIPNDVYSNFVNKWSKLWATQANSQGPRSSDKTGINFPYMRYADVLLMYAETINELEDGVKGVNGEKAKNALRQVRSRAFNYNDAHPQVNSYVEDVSATKETFFEAIFNERKWEFGGENHRWKDLVRWNMYAQVVYGTFMDYLTVGYYNIDDRLNGTDRATIFGFPFRNLPFTIWYRRVANNHESNIERVDNPDLYVTVEGTVINYGNQLNNKYPHEGTGAMQVVEIYNPYRAAGAPMHTTVYDQTSNYLRWASDGADEPRGEVMYSFRGYIRAGLGANYNVIDPLRHPVRYILPIPRDIINKSEGKYINYYQY